MVEKRSLRTNADFYEFLVFFCLYVENSIFALRDGLEERKFCISLNRLLSKYFFSSKGESSFRTAAVGPGIYLLWGGRELPIQHATWVGIVTSFLLSWPDSLGWDHSVNRTHWLGVGYTTSQMLIWMTGCDEHSNTFSGGHLCPLISSCP